MVKPVGNDPSALAPEPLPDMKIELQFAVPFTGLRPFRQLHRVEPARPWQWSVFQTLNPRV